MITLYVQIHVELIRIHCEIYCIYMYTLGDVHCTL